MQQRDTYKYSLNLNVQFCSKFILKHLLGKTLKPCVTCSNAPSLTWIMTEKLLLMLKITTLSCTECLGVNAQVLSTSQIIE